MLIYKYKKILLYNRNELLNQLGLATNTLDEEIVLIAYQKWGEKLFNKLNGDFAFVLYDTKEKIYIATRDALGVNALYYTYKNDQYYFSDDIDILLMQSQREKAPCEKSLKSMLLFNEVAYEETMYKEIYRVPPGHYLRIHNNNKDILRYWFPEKITISYEYTLNDAIEQFNILFKNAIENRVSNDERTAYELSGGLDSSSIACVQKSHNPKKIIDCYSMVFTGLKCDEMEHIKSIEEKYKFHSNKVELAHLDYKKQYDFNFNYELSPHWPINTTFTMYFPMIEMMKKNKKNVIITGQGGDHILSGQCDMLAELLKRFEIRKLYEEKKAFKKGVFGYIARCVFWPLFSSKIKNIIKILLLKSRRDKQNTINIDLFGLEQIKSDTKRYDIHALVSPSQYTNMDANIFHVIEKKYNLSFRHPFYDKKLVEFMLSLPPEYKYSKGYIKVLLRYAMEDILPEKVRLRKDKAEFSDVLRQQLEVLDLDQLFLDSKLLKLGIMKNSKIQKLLDSFKNKDEHSIVELWSIVNVEFWYQKSFKS